MRSWIQVKKILYKYSIEKTGLISTSISSYISLPPRANQWPRPTNLPPSVSWSVPSPPPPLPLLQFRNSLPLFLSLPLHTLAFPVHHTQSSEKSPCCTSLCLNFPLILPQWFPTTDLTRPSSMSLVFKILHCGSACLSQTQTFIICSFFSDSSHLLDIALVPSASSFSPNPV